MNRTQLGLTTGLVLMAACAACTSGDVARKSFLPFRVAVAAGEIATIADATPELGDDPGLLLSLDAESLARQITAELATEVFADATMLTIPGGSEPDALVRAADAAGANLLLECRVVINPRVATRLNDRVWLNFVLFAIGGPFSWFVPDRSYDFEARIVAHLHQVEPLLDGSATVADRRSRLAYVDSQVSEVDLHFFDRVGWSAVPLLGSMLIPASFLVPEGGNVRSLLAEETTRQLARDLGRQIVAAQHQILEGGLVTEIGLEDAGVHTEGAEVWFRAVATLRRGAAERLDSYTLAFGDQRVQGAFDERDAAGSPDGDGVTRKYPFAVKLPAPMTAPHVRVELVAGGRDRLRRSFCVPVRW